MVNLLRELIRNKVFRVPAFYTIVALVLTQLVNVVLCAFNPQLWEIRTKVLVFIPGVTAAQVNSVRRWGII